MTIRATAIYAIRYSLFVILCPLWACSGRANIQFVSLNMTEIDPPQPKVWEFDAQQSYWWIDKSGELNIAAKHEERSLILGKLGRVDLGISLAFDEPPAGRARNYKIGQREARVLFHSGLSNQRFLPYAGIVSVIFRDDRVVRGSFRLWMAPVAELSILSVLPRRPGTVLCFGTFEAIHDEERGKSIRQYCESDGYSRPARVHPATTQPAR